MPAARLLEIVLVAALLAVALLPLVVRAWRRSSRPTAVVVVLVWLGVPPALTWSAARLDDLPPPESAVRERPIEVPVEDYVTSKACEACHPSEYATWHRSYHRTMTQVARAESVMGDFDDVWLERDGQRFHLTHQGDMYWVEMDDPTWRGASAPPRVKRKVLLTTGSHWDQVYWLDSGRPGRVLAPFLFYYSLRLQRWAEIESAYLAPPDFGDVKIANGDWNITCIRCHSTLGRTRYGELVDYGLERGFDTQVVEFGIACEACHGPGEEHVRRNRNPMNRFFQYLTGDRDGSIVNPARLDSKRASQVCGQCHGISLPVEPDDAEDGKGWEPAPYRPGDDLTDTRYFVQTRYLHGEAPPDERHKQQRIREFVARSPHFLDGSFWDDGMVRISGRDYSAMIASPCFERGELSCLDCHTMHRKEGDERSLDEWAHHQVKQGMYGNLACVQCHAEYEDEATVTAHTRHDASSSGSLCYNCHMPYTTYGMQKGIRSHQIDSPGVAASVETGRPNACNLCHLDQTMAWAAEKLEQWYGIAPPELDEDQSTIGAGPLWALTGRAGQRALTAYAMRWEPALRASGKEWMTPILSQLLADPYYSVRFIAARSLQLSHEGFEGFEYDFTRPGREQDDALFRARLIWSESIGAEAAPRSDAVLLDEDGALQFSELQRLLDQRDDRNLWLLE